MSHERAFRFGRAEHLIGIAGLPDVPAPVGVIVLNAGMVHRVGPFRLHVDLTRRLNAAGYATLRMDLSTLGDSGASPRAASRTEQVRGDVADAMALLKQHAGCERFVLIGLCAGAANSHAVAQTNHQVAGVVFLDGYVYRTFGQRARHYLPRLASPKRVWRYVQRAITAVSRPREAMIFDVTVPPRAQVIADYTDMLVRRLKLYFIYSGGISDFFNHARQFRECYGRIADDPGVRVDYLARTDHTYALAGDRHEVVERIAQWMNTQFPVDKGMPA